MYHVEQVLVLPQNAPTVINQNQDVQESTGRRHM